MPILKSTIKPLPMSQEPLNNALYHYCKLSTALEHILPMQKLLLNQLTKTNDPRENSDFTLNLFCYPPNRNINPNEVSERFNKKIKEECKVVCFSSDSPPYYGYEYSRLWSHYGDSHKGLCLKINKEKFIAENSHLIDEKLLQPITYYQHDVKRPFKHKRIDYSLIERHGEQEYFEIFRQDYLQYFYFTKNHEWESEKEYRLIHFSSKQEDEFCSIHNSIEEIYVGVDFCKTYVPLIKLFCPNVKIYKLKYTEVRLTISVLL